MQIIIRGKKITNMQTLYVSRPLLNGNEIREWAKKQGFESTLSEDDMHVTIAFSKSPVEWPSSKKTDFVNDTKNRNIRKFGDAIVLTFPSKILEKRWQEFMDLGASWDFPSYKSHITISYNDMDIDSIEPFFGELKFGPEEFKKIDDDWRDTMTEDDL
jgi:hypothetical protein